MWYGIQVTGRMALTCHGSTLRKPQIARNSFGAERNRGAGSTRFAEGEVVGKGHGLSQHMYENRSFLKPTEREWPLRVSILRQELTKQVL